jgi:2-polyprenyl-6-hydroxyphenyl methylase/3-demethylubiquinone-9 3-methyltransferase
VATDTGQNAEPAELDKFNRLARDWWDETGPLATLHAINPLRVGYIASCAELGGARVLDVGCGAGILSEALARRGAAVTGIDLASESIRIAGEHAAAEGLLIDYRVQTVEQLAAAEPGTYDVVTCLELLEHLPEPETAIAACARAVRPGGAIFLSTINRNLKSFMLAIVGAEYALRMLPRGTHEYLKLIKPAEIGRAARTAGLVIEDLTGLHYNPLTQTYRLGGNVDVNYLVFATRPESA